MPYFIMQNLYILMKTGREYVLPVNLENYSSSAAVGWDGLIFLITREASALPPTTVFRPSGTVCISLRAKSSASPAWRATITVHVILALWEVAVALLIAVVCCAWEEITASPFLRTSD